MAKSFPSLRSPGTAHVGHVRGRQPPSAEQLAAAKLLELLPPQFGSPHERSPQFRAGHVGHRGPPNVVKSTLGQMPWWGGARCPYVTAQPNHAASRILGVVIAPSLNGAGRPPPCMKSTPSDESVHAAWPISHPAGRGRSSVFCDRSMRFTYEDNLGLERVRGLKHRCSGWSTRSIACSPGAAAAPPRGLTHALSGIGIVPISRSRSDILIAWSISSVVALLAFRPVVASVSSPNGTTVPSARSCLRS